MRSEQAILDLLKRWADQQANVRAILLVSSRADPRRQPDVLSDYDVEVFVREVRPFMEHDAWVSDFGDITVRWPATPRPTLNEDWVTQLGLYEDGIRIDFQITTLAPSASENLDHGYRVLVVRDLWMGVGIKGKNSILLTPYSPVWAYRWQLELK